MTPIEINNMLEQINCFTPDDDEARKQKAYNTYIKRLEYGKAYAKNNREKINKLMLSHYHNNEEYRNKANKARQLLYYKNKYGMTPEEHKQKKEEEIKTLIEQLKPEYKQKIDDSFIIHYEKIIKNIIKKTSKKTTKKQHNDSETSETSNDDIKKENARNRYYLKRYNMTEQEYKQKKEEEYNKDLEKYKDKFNNVFIPSYVEAH